MRYLNIIYNTIVDGPGIRNSIYLAGCNHRCDGCHNPSSWDFDAGSYLSSMVLEDFIEKTIQDPSIQGVTISGGDPFCQSLDDLLNLVSKLYESGIKDIWIYSGYTFEEISSMDGSLPILEMITALVDGEFVEEQKCYDKKFVGSSNQRVINVPSSILTGTIKLRRY